MPSYLPTLLYHSVVCLSEAFPAPLFCCLMRSSGPSDDRQTRLLAFRINQPAFSCLSEQLSNLIFSEADLFPHLAIGQQLIFSIDLQDLFHIRLLLYHWGRSCRLLDWWAILCFFLTIL